MTPIQTVALFITGYLVSRFVLRARVHEVFVDWLVRRSAGRVSQVVLWVMFLAFALSTVVPNTLTVLSLLPVVKRLRDLAAEDAQRGLVSTLLVMGLIYGANIGGVGSLLGSPANVFLLVNLELYAIPDREHLHFVSWLAFGIPMAASLVLLSWGVIGLMSPKAFRSSLRVTSYEPAERPPLFRVARNWALVFLAGWTVLLIAAVVTGLGRAPEEPLTWFLFTLDLPNRSVPVDLLDLISVVFSVGLVVLAMTWPLRTEQGTTRLLRVRDLVRELPWGGLAIAAGVLVLLVVIAKSGAVTWFRDTVPDLLPRSDSPFLAALALVVITILSTEVLNNTTVATVMFPVAAVGASNFGADPLLVMLAVSLASTCAFMTPVATPVNALALASLRGVVLRRFLWTGLWVNLVAALWIALWATWLIPPILGLFRG